MTGDRRLRGRATGVDPESGSLVVEVEGREWSVGSGEVTHCQVLG